MNSGYKLYECRRFQGQRSKSVNYCSSTVAQGKETFIFPKPRSYSQGVLSSRLRVCWLITNYLIFIPLKKNDSRESHRAETKKHLYARPSLKRTKYGSPRYSKFWEQTFCVILFFFLSFILVFLIIFIVSLM